MEGKNIYKQVNSNFGNALCTMQRPPLQKAVNAGQPITNLKKKKKIVTGKERKKNLQNQKREGAANQS